MNHSNSNRAFQEALKRMPGGVNSPARAFGAVGGSPIFFERGEGAYLFDLDGNRYIDYVGSWGPLILGHAYPSVVEAIEKAARRGTTFGAPTEAETELASVISDCVPSVQKIRFVNSGTEATMSAIRLARGFTGRDRIIKFAGNYHGHADCLLVAAGSSAATLSVPNSAGVPASATRDTIVLQYNDTEALETTFQKHGNSIAAIILEPIVGNMGVVEPSCDFLDAARRLTVASGALLIFDEVMTGFRVALGGAQAHYGVTPDLTTFGKIIGGGLPVGAYGGRSDVMDYVLPLGSVFQAGTLSGNPLATAAGIATLKVLQSENLYALLEARTARLESGWKRTFEAKGIPVAFSRVGSMATIFFLSRRPTNWEEAKQCDTNQYAKWFWGMIAQGVYLPCSQFEAMFVSFAHSEADIDATIRAAEQVV